jgi:regulator of sigma E protease
MDGLLGIVGTAADLGLVLLGFTLIIVIHELGHFAAARWAGIRVLAFAVGFGPALVSFRKGLGFARGSTEEQLAAAQRGEGNLPGGVSPRTVSPTEYRFNLIPFGGYVKMLGQDDADPSARSDAPDSFQSAPIWKRMIVISAGVVLNVITAALLFVIVFMAGLETEPAKVGAVRPDSPAAQAVATNAAELGVTEPGLRAGDRIVSIDGHAPDSFKDVALTVAMSSRNRALDLLVEREGLSAPLRFAILPRESEQTRMLDLGIAPASSGQLIGASFNERQAEDFRRTLAERGITGLDPGLRLVSVDGKPATSFYDLDRALAAGGGRSVLAGFAEPAPSGDAATTGPVREVPIPATAELPTVLYDTPLGRIAVTELLGLVPVMSVRSIERGSGGEEAGLQAGDVFAQLGDLEWPNIPEGILEIHRGQRASIPIAVERSGTTGIQPIGPVRVTRGRIGFGFGNTAETAAIVARHPVLLASVVVDPAPSTSAPSAPSAPPAAEAATAPPPTPPAVPSGARLGLAPGSRILSVNGQPVANFPEIRNALQAAARAAPNAAESGLRVTLRVRPALRDSAAAQAAEHEVAWSIPAHEVRELLPLGWASRLPETAFTLEKTTLRGVGPSAAIALGLRETHRVMVSTYLTFVRLFQGTVRVEHLKGPVGIAHTGTLIAERGFIWLLFFMAVISVNLAVINFLPLPIVDGGHFLFLLWEQLTGRPVSVLVQNLATLAGLALIGSVFLIVTFNDLANLFWR